MIFKFFTQIRHCYKQPATKLSLRRGFHNAFGKHLLFTNTWTSGVLMFVGDVVEQEIEIQRNLMDEFDWGRFGRMFLTGLLFGPVHHYFYMWMNRKLPHRSVPVVFKKILLDQFIMSPICIILFFYTIGALEGKPTKEVTKEMKDKFVNVYVTAALKPLTCLMPMSI
ncbi:hypothetical protein FQA39_LY02539 [Lamprigera yunnana]|nr:hypothetical protein FQA39_LY02539 [Lamprigera yunnana]